MLDWLKKWRDQKRAKIIFQNAGALEGSVIRPYLTHKADVPALERLDEIAAENARIAGIAESTGIIADADVDMLMDMNAELQVFHDEAARALKIKGEETKAFDEAYEPEAGWETYFAVPTGIA